MNSGRKAVIGMTDFEQLDVKIQRQIDAQNARIDNVLAKIDMLVAESQQQREDMRRLWERQDELQAKHDADMHEMNQRLYDKIDATAKELTQQLHTYFVQTMIGVSVIMAAIGGLIIAALK